MHSSLARLFAVFVLTVLFVANLAPTARAANWYVDAAATGSHNGTSQANAWTSFAQITQSSLSGGDIVWVQSGTYDERFIITKGGTSASARITYMGTGPTKPVLRGIQSSGFDYIGVLNLEFTHPNITYAYNCIVLNSGCDGWLIEDNYFHDTTGGGIDLHNQPCNNTIIRHNAFNNMSWIGLGALGANTITLNGDNNLCEYNTIGASLDRIYVQSGSKVVARNNNFTGFDVAAFTATLINPFHLDGFQGGLNDGFPIVQQVMWERNLNVDQRESVGRNSHGWIFQDDQTVPTANWFVDRFNILVRPSGGSHVFQQLLSFYNYNNTYIGLGTGGTVNHDPAIFWGPGAGSAPLPEGVSTWLNNTWSLSPTLLTVAGGIFDTAATTFPTSFSSDYQHSWNSGSVGGLLPTASHNLAHVNPRFSDPASDDYTLQSGSPLKAAGGPVTTANGAGSSSTALTVVEAKRLFDGWGIADADWIKIGAGAYVQISSINYSTSVVTLSAARTWSNGDPVIVKGMEDIGALPYGYTQSFAVTNTTPSGAITAGPTTLTATCPNPDAVRMVEFLVDGLPVGIAYTSPYSVAWTSDGLLHNIEARAYNAWASRAPTVRSSNTFVTNPASQTVVAGATVNFSATATGTILSYRWQKNGVPLSDGGIVSGATTASLTLTGVSAADAANYSVVAINAAGPAVSGDAALDLATLPAITANPSPASQVVAPGATVVYTAAASGIPTPTFQWQKGGVPLSDGGVVSGSGTATLTLTGVTTSDTGTYTVVATNVAGSSAPSSGAVLNVAVLPSFTIPPPATPSVATGSTTSILTVVAIGPPTPTYQWQKGGVNLTNGGVYSGVTTATLTLTNLTGVDAGTYRAVATNPAGSTNSSNAVLTVTGSSAPVITVQPAASQTVTPGATVTFNVTVAGTPAPTLQWQKGGVPLANGGIVSGATSTTLTLTGVSVSDAGTYTVVATSAGSPPPATSNNAVLNVTAPPPPPPPPPPSSNAPAITTQPVSQSAIVGGSAVFSAVATGTPGPDYQWRRNAVAISGATGSTLTLTGLSLSDSGAVFDVIVSNSNGSATSNPAILTVTSGIGTVFSGDLGVGGKYSLFVRSDGTAVLIASLPNGRGNLVVNFVVGADGTFHSTTSVITAGSVAADAIPDDLSPPSTAEAVTVLSFSGSIANGQLVGQIDSTGEAFAGLAQVLGGASPGAGYYEAPALNGGSGTAYVIVSPSGAVTGAILTGGIIQAGVGTLGADGKFTLQLSGNLVFDASLNSANGSISGLLTSKGAATGTFSGVADNVTHTDRLVNISARGSSGDNEQVIISGFIIGGSQSKTILVRAIGPSLTSLGVSGVMENPVLTIYDANRNAILTNDDWSASTNSSLVSATATQVGAFALAAGSKDAAIVATLPPGAYTAQATRAANSANGVALIEVYDASSTGATTPDRLVNISSRGQVRTGDGILIDGFIVSGNAPKKMLIRGVGPSLAAFGVGNLLANPFLRLFQGNTVIASNDDWGSGDANAIAVAAAQVGAFALGGNSKDSVLLLTLVPGLYTAQLSGSDGGSGVALLEVYEVQ